MSIRETETNRINTKGLIVVSHIHYNSDGVNYSAKFKLIFCSMVLEVKQYVKIGPGDSLNDPSKEPGFWYIKAVRIQAINSLKWWRRLFPTPLRVDGLCIQCNIPILRNNQYGY